VKTNWRQDGWNLQTHDEVLYNIACAGLLNSPRDKVGPMMPTCGRFDSLDYFFDIAAVPEVTHVEIKTPHQLQHQLQQEQQKQPTDSSSKGRKRRYPPFISEAADTTGYASSGQSESNRHGKSGGGGQSSGFLSAPWVSVENFHRRHSTSKCLRCESLNHKASFCPKFSQAGNPPQHDQTLAQ